MTTGQTIEFQAPPKDHYSHSAFSAAALCGKKYEYKYIVGAQGPSNSSLVFGSVIHDALEFAAKEQMKTGTRPRTQIITEFAVGGLSIEIARAQERTGMPIEWKKVHKTALVDTLESLKKDCVNTIATYEMQEGHKLQPMLVEQQFSVVLPGVDVPIEGYIDLVNKPGRVIDYKTSAKKLQEASAIMSEQLTIYQIALDDDGIPVDSLELHGIIRKVGGADVQVLTVPRRTEEQKQEYIKNAVEAAKLIQARIFPKVNNGMICSWCDFKKQCHPDWYPVTAAQEEAA